MTFYQGRRDAVDERERRVQAILAIGREIRVIADAEGLILNSLDDGDMYDEDGLPV